MAALDDVTWSRRTEDTSEKCSYLCEESCGARGRWRETRGVRGARSKEFGAMHERKHRFWNDPNDGLSLGGVGKDGGFGLGRFGAKPDQGFEQELTCRDLGKIF